MPSRVARPARRQWPRRLLLGLLALSLAWPAAPAHAGPEQDLTQAELAYGRGEFKRSIELIRPLLYPAIRLSSQQQVLKAYKLLGISYVFERQTERARKQFLALLSIQPTYRLDPLVDPVAAVDLFEEVKRRNAEKIKAILERERREAERQQRERERREAEQRRLRELAQRKPTLIERTIVQHPYWINFVPLGAGQFQNGQHTKGWLLLGTQAGFGALSLGSWLGVTLAYGGKSLSPEQYDRARALTTVQLVSGGICLAAVVYGVIDALVYHQPRTVSERRSEGQRPITPAPASQPGGQAAGISGLQISPMLGLDGRSGSVGVGFEF